MASTGSSTQVTEIGRNGVLAVYRKTGMSQAEFVRDHLEPAIPVVFGDATAAWPARQQFTPEFFRTHYPDRQVKVGRKGLDDSDMRLADFIALAEVATRENPAPYPCKLHLDPREPGDRALVAATEPRYSFALPNRTGHRLLPRRFLGSGDMLEVFFGSPGGEFPYLHIDYMGLNAFINQLYGHKEFTVIPPGQTDCVYPDPDNPWVSMVADHHRPDLDRYPLMRGATPVSFVVGPGQSLFIPNGWWHTARSLDVTISVAFDGLTRVNWPRFVAEAQRMYKQPWKSALVGGYLQSLGGLMALVGT